eukprot:gene21195-28098_t
MSAATESAQSADVSNGVGKISLSAHAKEEDQFIPDMPTGPEGSLPSEITVDEKQRVPFLW